MMINIIWHHVDASEESVESKTLTPAGLRVPSLQRKVDEEQNACREDTGRIKCSPLGDEVYKLDGKAVSRQLWRRLIHHLFELLEGGPPWLVGELQNGQLDLRGRGQGSYTLHPNVAFSLFKPACCILRFGNSLNTQEIQQYTLSIAWRYEGNSRWDDDVRGIKIEQKSLERSLAPIVRKKGRDSV